MILSGHSLVLQVSSFMPHIYIKQQAAHIYKTESKEKQETLIKLKKYGKKLNKIQQSNQQTEKNNQFKEFEKMLTPKKTGQGWETWEGHI